MDQALASTPPAHEAPLLTRKDRRIGWMLLNRPNSLNALTLPMIRAAQPFLADCASDPNIRMIVVEGAGERAFCAGGDLKTVYEAKQKQDLGFLDDLFKEEYRFNTLIHTYPKPYLSLIQGIAMGGGLGVSVHGTHRVVSEHALFAMPEVGIGYFPDIGASYFLNRCPGKVGLYLGLTGTSIKAGDALYAGLATHFVPRARHEDLKKSLIEESPKTREQVSEIVERSVSAPPHADLKTHQDEIDACFEGDSVEEVLENLQACGSDFALQARKTILSKSPLSVKITFEQLKRSRTMSFLEAIEMEYRLSRSFIENPDFFEGIRAVVVDKDKTPRWNAQALDSLTPEIIEAYFSNHKNLPLFEG